MHKVFLTCTCGASTLKSTGIMVLAYCYNFTSYETYGPGGYLHQLLFLPNAWEHFPTSASAHMVPFSLHIHSISAHLSWQKLTCPSEITSNAVFSMKVFHNAPSQTWNFTIPLVYFACFIIIIILSLILKLHDRLQTPCRQYLCIIHFCFTPNFILF